MSSYVDTEMVSIDFLWRMLFICLLLVAWAFALEASLLISAFLDYQNNGENGASA